MWVAIILIIGTLASLVGVYAIVDNRRNRRVKALAYEYVGAIPLATASRHEQDYELAVVYRSGEGQPEERIEAAYVTYLRFANFGKEPIRAVDIAPANPLRIEVEGVRVLDISLSSTCRDVSQVTVGRPDLGDSRATANVSFDFLDYEDGGMVRILTAGWGSEVKLQLTGDIIGMRGGIMRTDAEPPHKEVWGKIGVGAFIASEVAAFAATAYVFKLVAGSWADVWLMILPLVALVAPAFVAAIISDTIWPSSTKRKAYPKALALPRWLGPFPPPFANGPTYFWPPMTFVGEELRPSDNTDVRQGASPTTTTTKLRGPDNGQDGSAPGT